MSIDSVTQEHKKVLKVGNRVIGYFEGNRFIKSVVGSRHKLKFPPAYCLSAEVFEQIKADISEIIVRDRESGLIYRSSVDNFTEHCFEIQRGSFERQLALTLNHWEVTRNGQHQPSLFGGETQ